MAQQREPAADAGLAMSVFDYELPPDRIAAYPPPRRRDARLLVLHRATGRIRHLRFRDLPSLVAPGDLLVVNDTRVLPARLLGRKPSGAAVEVLLLRPADQSTWEALVRPGRKLKPGRTVEVAPELSVRILDVLPNGNRLVRLDTPLPVSEALSRFGRVPLPPYLNREDEPLDRERYQTVYARHDGSVAAPTAGLHFDRELLAAVDAGGASRCAVTLHVGPGTFRPVETEDPADHRMQREDYHVSESAADAHRKCRAKGGRAWAVGTTVVRTLESAWAPDGPRVAGAGSPDDLRAAGAGSPDDRRVAEAGSPTGGVCPGAGATDLFIRPPYEFRAVDCLVTNFHLPRSTLLMLVSAFGGVGPVRRAYREAVDAGYRFYSYGDAMAVLP